MCFAACFDVYCIDKNGNKVLEGVVGTRFVNRLAAAYDKTTGKCGYINAFGETVIPFEYYIPRLYPFDMMENGIVRLWKAETATQRYIRSDGTILGKVDKN